MEDFDKFDRSSDEYGGRRDGGSVILSKVSIFLGLGIVGWACVSSGPDGPQIVMEDTSAVSESLAVASDPYPQKVLVRYSSITRSFSPAAGHHNDPLDEAVSALNQGQTLRALDIIDEIIARVPPGWQPISLNQKKNIISYSAWSPEEFEAFINSGNQGINVQWVVPSFSRAYFLKSYILVDQKNYEKAMAVIKEGLQLEPDHPSLLSEAALVEGRLGQYEKAIELYAKIPQRKWDALPTVAQALRGVGANYIKLKKLDEAEVALVKSLALAPCHSGARAGLDKIDAMRGKEAGWEDRDCRNNLNSLSTVMRGIRLFQKDFLGEDSHFYQKIIMDFAEKSPLVSVNIQQSYSGSKWISDEGLSRDHKALFLAAYVAGSVEHQVLTGTKGHNHSKGMAKLAEAYLLYRQDNPPVMALEPNAH